MRFGRVVLASGLIGVGVVALSQSATAQVATCTGNEVIQQAPYTCQGTRTDAGITTTAVLSVDAVGRAVADFTLTEPAAAPVPIAMHSWIGIDTGPDIVVTGAIPQGSTTGQLFIPVINCGQLDIKSVVITPGVPAGEIVGPYVTWGVNCQQAPTTVPTTVAPTTLGPTTTGSVSPTSAARPTSTLPTTGGDSSRPLTWAALGLVAGAALLLVSRRWGADAR